MIPQVQAVRFAASALIGLGLGVFYCFLRPLRPKLTALADGIFVTCALIGWTYAAFYFCRGDLRMGYTFGFFLGMGIGWREKDFGQLSAHRKGKDTWRGVHKTPATCWRLVSRR